MIRFSSFFALVCLFVILLPVQGQTREGSGYRQAFEELDSRQTHAANRLMYQGGNIVLNKALRAELMALPGNDFTFEELIGFVTENPHWPGRNGIIMIAEQKMPSWATPRDIVKWFDAYPPLTHAGFHCYIDALKQLGQTQKATNLIRERWINTQFSKSDREDFHSRYGRNLRAEDHWKRLDRLLWENGSSEVAVMYGYVSANTKKLAQARLALANDSANVNALIRGLPASLKKDPGLMYERLKWRRGRGMNDGAMEILNNPPPNLGRPELWWRERHIMARRMMEKKDFGTAYRLVARHGMSAAHGAQYLQAEFLAGFLSLRFRKEPARALSHFTNMTKAAQTPISRSRAYYWQGRAFDALGRSAEARQAYEEAGALDTTYYGQLALTKINPNPVLYAKPEPYIPDNVRNQFFAQDRIQAIIQLDLIGAERRAERFFIAAMRVAERRADFVMLIDLAYQRHRPDWAVRAAKAANMKNHIISGPAFPLLAMPIPSAPDPALTHALIRQESQFTPDARSPVGALGLMQLMPGTARETAQKIGMPYKPDSLTDPDYNIRLGTYFFQRQIDAFDGSIVLALAGYNAGPSRARQWVNTFGDPRTRHVDSIDWIELMPIYETRNYVQRIVENLQCYRARLNNGAAPLRILDDIKR